MCVSDNWSRLHQCACDTCRRGCGKIPVLRGRGRGGDGSGVLEMSKLGARGWWQRTTVAAVPLPLFRFSRYPPPSTRHPASAGNGVNVNVDAKMLLSYRCPRVGVRVWVCRHVRVRLTAARLCLWNVLGTKFGSPYHLHVLVHNHLS